MLLHVLISQPLASVRTPTAAEGRQEEVDNDKELSKARL
jgi:hypothetical protein